MAEIQNETVYLSPAPHIGSKQTTANIMLTVIITLLPLCAYGVYLFRLPALITILTSLVSCIVFESLFRLATKQDIRAGDFSAAVTGIMLALILPPTTPVWMTILGALFAIIVAKEFFGGLGANVFNPALAGRAMLFVSFSVTLGTWTMPLDGMTGATILPELTAGTASISTETYLTYFIGNHAGCIGETSAALILLAFVVLLIRGIIDWRTPSAMVAVTAGATFLTGGDPLMSVLSGGLLFGAVFMTTDPATAPITGAGKLIFGAGCGLFTFLIRTFGNIPEGVMYSILVMNILVPFLNNIVPRKYGYKKQPKGGAK